MSKNIELMYITNRPEVAKIADEAGVDRIWIDLEYKGKEERQKGMNTVKSKHFPQDILKIKPLLKTASIMVRINPWDEESSKEIETVISYGTEYIMLPMYRTAEEVKEFVACVGGRAKTMLLLETKEAMENLESYIEIPGIDEVHIGLNDLHLALKKKFMFELLIDGTVENICKKLKKYDKKYGFGGFARIGHGLLPAECILTEHYALESTMAILSRGFCDANIVQNPEDIRDVFFEGVSQIREYEQKVKNYTLDEYKRNHERMVEIIQNIIK